MLFIPKKATDRFIKESGNFQKILRAAKDRDVNESDTVTIITDILSDILGYDKYAEITSELAIRGTFCDLAIKLDGNIKYIIEVKAIGLDLKENHLKQAVNYGANHGVPWVVLTNGIFWELYRIKFERPISSDLVLAFNFLELNQRKGEDQEKLFLLSKEGISKAAVEVYHEHIQSVNRFAIAVLITTDAVVEVIRRELRRITPDTKVTKDEIKKILNGEVLKRDVIEGEEAKKAMSRIRKATGKLLRKVAKQNKPLTPPESTL
ncbi:MAG: type I restriction enzyme HsdR N-terminal domain-containing protein [candidate division Zixibacteria bacterium]